MADTSIPLLYGVISIITIYLLHQVVCLLDLHCSPLKYLISGKPSIVINKDGVDEFQLKKNSMDISDLMESLRAAGYFSISSVAYALYEANGTFSALPKVGYEEEQQSLPYLIIADGKFKQENIDVIGLPLSFFKDILQKHSIKSEKSVLVMTLDGTGKIYLQERGKKKIDAHAKIPEEFVW